MSGEDTSYVSVILQSIDISLREIRQELSGKASESRVRELEQRFNTLERDSVSQDAVTSAVAGIKSNRARIWVAVGLAAFAQVVNIVLYIASLKGS